ncbi:MAG: amidohydrolase family protein [Clostridia bacterium]|nr:amidohydrolase family protein [Clostridia bacterium]
MKIFDIHTHSNCGLKNDCPENELHKRNFEFLMKEYENAGVSAGGFSYFSAILGTDEIYESNELLFKKAQGDGRVYQWLVLDPRQDKLFSQIEGKIKNEKVLGIKIQSKSHGYDILEYADKIFSFANDLGCFVLMHPDKTPRMAEFANKYPNMNLIIAHLCGVEHVDAILNAKHGNIFTDTSGMDSRLNNIVEYAVERVGSEKIFFGTDTYSCGFQRGRIEYARIGDKDKENILYNNAKAHFGMIKI